MRLTTLVACSVLVQGLALGEVRAGASRTEGSAPARPNPRALDIAQAHVEGPSLVVSDSRKQRWPLTLDVGLQRSAHRRLAEARPEQGAFVAIEAKTGKLKVFTQWQSPASHNKGLLFGLFPAASVFKIVTTAALLEQARIDPKRAVCTEGGAHRIEREQLEAPRTGIAECHPFFEALGFSRNAVFAQLANRFLKPEDLENYADRFRLNSTLPIEVDIPMGHFETRDDSLGFARAAAGFEGSQLSPLGAAYLAYIIASGGRASPLHVFEVERNGVLDKDETFHAIRPETARTLRQMMEVTVRRGTCARAFHDEQGRHYLDGIAVAGKTGTLDEQENTYSWFVGFAPSRAPEIVVSVLLKNGHIWHKKANEVGREWLVDYFSRRAQMAESRPPRANTAS